jgi:hypothetical protein
MRGNSAAHAEFGDSAAYAQSWITHNGDSHALIGSRDFRRGAAYAKLEPVSGQVGLRFLGKVISGAETERPQRPWKQTHLVERFAAQEGCPLPGNLCGAVSDCN